MIKPEPPKPPPMRVIKDDGIGMMIGAAMITFCLFIMVTLAAKVFA